MNLPPVACAPGNHRELLGRIQMRLHQQYEMLLKLPRATPAQARRAGRKFGNVRMRRHAPFRPMTPASAHRPPLRRRDDWRGEGARASLGTVFVFVLVLHIAVVGAIIVANLDGSSWLWQVTGGVLLGLVALRVLGKIARRIRSRLRTTAHRGGRNCDRDIWL